MKSSIGIALLLLFASTQSVSNAQEYYPNEQENCDHLNDINDARLQSAKKTAVANMHALSWNRTLESKVIKMNCDELKIPGPDYAAVGFAAIDENNPSNSLTFHPLQTQMGCGNTKCNDKMVCLLGPRITASKESDYKRGEPGTQCSSGSGASGLCGDGGVCNGKIVSSVFMSLAFLSLALTIIMSKTISNIPSMNASIGIAFLLLVATAESLSDADRYNIEGLTKQEHVNVVNKARLEAAKEHNIANMHEVTWDTALESKIDKIDTCDYSPGPDYAVFVYPYHSLMSMLKGQTNGGDPMREPHFHPLQTKIACRTVTCTKAGSQMNGICLVGPENSPAKESDIKHGAPGSECTGGNVKNWLCVSGAGIKSTELKDGEEAASSASMPMTLFSLALGLIMA
ncbi:hypothetical protein GCK72_003207 [Caenorhabditis remanei]|uniref:SCP domain-containing protein n=1 Tax=Caenorhabditis remanei TaxID=31234 RepID=A0A6A5HVY6_CAERE|nr:hypothetical protein GCK72_003207 [Caenorhabditis remanei]KAF1771381.1 hypothetical protein GCK72_003207 [Caenorhabditis remanei]